MGFRVVGFSLLLTVGVSVALEFAGWRIALDTPSAPASGINAAAFLRGALDTMLGAVGIGAIGALSTLTSPKTWRRPWRRLPVGFLGGSLAFLGFLSALTLSYFL